MLSASRLARVASPDRLTQANRTRNARRSRLRRGGGSNQTRQVRSRRKRWPRRRSSRSEPGACQRHCDKGEARREIVSGVRYQPHARSIAARENPEAVMLDLVQPFRPRWRPLGAGREAGRNMAERTAGPRFYDGVRGQSGPGPLARPGLCCLIARTCQFGNPTLGPTTLFGVSVGH
jgi:hypothetical protein